jgi:hypothetical protein
MNLFRLMDQRHYSGKLHPGKVLIIRREMKQFFYFIFSKLPQYYAKLQLNWLDIEGLRLLGCNCWIMEQRRMAVFIGKSGFSVHVPANMRKNVWGDRGADRHIV